MNAWWSGRGPHLGATGAQLVLLLAGARIAKPAAWAATLALGAAISLWAWIAATRRQRAIDDTPTSRIASAAQGYVELQGRGRPLGGMPLCAPFTGLPCLWYRFRVERRDRGKWVHDHGGESDASFILDDGSGQCLVDPEGAEVRVTRRDRWSDDEHRYTMWLLIERDPVYVLGQFVTRGSVDLDLDAGADVKALLAQWKQDPQRLRARFDADRDGEIDAREWDEARREARREVEAQHRELRNQPEISLVRRPDDGRLYLISDLDSARLARRWRRWSWLQLGLFFVLLGGFAYALRRV